MAIVKGPAFSLIASGNVGGLCYAQWRGRQVARGAWTGTVPNTTAQQVYQQMLATVAQAWGGTLTQVERETWRMRARDLRFRDRLNELHAPSGYQLFMKWNLQRAVFGLGLLAEAPGGEEAIVELNFVVEYSQTGPKMVVSLHETMPGAPPDGIQYWRAGPFTSGGYTAQDPEYRLKAQVSPAGDWTDFDVQAGLWYWYKARCWSDDGTVGPFYKEQVFGEYWIQPDDLPGLWLWVRADLGITKDVANLVSGWADQSGNGRDLAQTVGIRQPLWEAVVNNGYPGVGFDGIDDAIRTGILTDYDQPFDWFVVFGDEVGAGVTAAVYDGRESLKTMFLLSDHSGVNNRYRAYAGSYLSWTAGVQPGYNMWEVDFDGTGGRIRFNGVSKVTGNIGIQVLSGVTMGSWYNYTLHIKAKVQEMVIYNRILTSEERTEIEGYLRDRYDLP